MEQKKNQLLEEKTKTNTAIEEIKRSIRLKEKENSNV